MDFTGKIALITGGASGIGRATALLFARHGAKLVIGDIDPAGAEAAEQILSNGGQAVFLKTDVTRQEDCKALVAAAIEHFGRLDCAANIAGIAASGGIFCPVELRDRSIAINLTGVFNSVTAEATAMQQNGGGAIVNVSSTTGLQGSADSPYYAAAKHGVIGFTKSAALELATDGIRVNAICPGFTHTPMTEGFFGENVDAIAGGHTPFGRVGQPEEQAEAILWLCSDAASFVTGAVLAVDGGLAAGPKSYRKSRA